MSELLAHSARDGAPEQSYRGHVGNVISQAMRFGREAATHCPKWRDGFLVAVADGPVPVLTAELVAKTLDELRGERGRVQGTTD